ncbi:MAG: [FeFe] hydrogenase H-cluster radical SAM maturase HydE [Lachnospiraceae bacterium]|nr:[FeFe] hydrogenase H-cluster radical SAM maturase HydE [Lachnospiraceae bacterium]
MVGKLTDYEDETRRRELFRRAEAVRQEYYGKDVYIRGLIEFTNYCKNDCYYCGIRASNHHIRRYRLDEEEILTCCKKGYRLGFRTFVLQGGEDPLYTPEKTASLVECIKRAYPDCALTLSVGEHPRQVYKQWFDAGADRYLLRHETADEEHYRKLHPASCSPENRKRCLWDLKEIGYQVGCGFMVGSPGQRPEHLEKDIKFICDLQPDMVGIGPFIPQSDTPFGRESAGNLELTLVLLAMIRVLLPSVLLPATTALGTLHRQGLEMGIQAGANVCMPNLTPDAVRDQYALYEGKTVENGGMKDEKQALDALKERMEKIGYRIVEGRGDRKNFVKISR